MAGTLTKLDLIESLPSRLRSYAVAEPVENINDANRLIAYWCAMFQEAVGQLDKIKGVHLYDHERLNNLSSVSMAAREEGEG